MTFLSFLVSGSPADWPAGTNSDTQVRPYSVLHVFYFFYFFYFLFLGIGPNKSLCDNGGNMTI